MAGYYVEASSKKPSTVNDEILSAEQRLDVLDAVDLTCGDIWCEGDYFFNFDSFSCSKEDNQCTLMFRMWQGDSSLDGSYEAFGDGENFSWRLSVLSRGLVLAECTVEPVFSFDDLIKSGDISRLTDFYYNSLNGCISQIENFVTTNSFK